MRCVAGEAAGVLEDHVVLASLSISSNQDHLWFPRAVVKELCPLLEGP